MVLFNNILEKNHAIVYYWWGHSPKPILNFNSPIIQSIQISRYYTNIPIYVLDTSTVKQDWEDYPNEFDFKVIKIKPALDFTNHQLTASKPFDFFNLADEIPEDIIIVLDTDTFWLKYPFPLEKNSNKFCCNDNCGFLYFNKKSPEVQTFRILWQELIKKCIKEFIFFDKVRKNTFYYHNFPNLNEELAYQYIIKNKSNLIDIVEETEHILLRYINPEKYKDTKLIHSAGEFHEKRALLSLVIEDLYKINKNLKIVQKIELINKSKSYKRLTQEEMTYNNIKKEIDKLLIQNKYI